MDERFPQIIRQWLGSQQGTSNEFVDTPKNRLPVSVKQARQLKEQSLSTAKKRHDTTQSLDRLNFHWSILNQAFAFRSKQQRILIPWPTNS